MQSTHFPQIAWVVLMAQVKLSLAERLMLHSNVNPNGCIEWIGYNVRGYGQITVAHKGIQTHRLAWTLSNGPIPEGLLVLHHCDNPPCINPDHLFLGTHQDNMNDMSAKGRGNKTNAFNLAKTHCKQGHEFTPENTYIKSNGARRCKNCNRIRALASYHRKKQNKQFFTY